MDERIIKRLVEMRACKPAVDWLREFATPQQAWDACKRGDQMLWLIHKTADRDDEAQLRRLVLAEARCSQFVIHLIKDARSREFVNTAIAFGEGRASWAELDAATDADAEAGYEGAYAFADAYHAAAARGDIAMLEVLSHSAGIVRALYPECPKFW